jgi:hypothetical protein
LTQNLNIFNLSGIWVASGTRKKLITYPGSGGQKHRIRNTVQNTATEERFVSRISCQFHTGTVDRNLKNPFLAIFLVFQNCGQFGVVQYSFPYILLHWARLFSIIAAIGVKGSEGGSRSGSGNSAVIKTNSLKFFKFCFDKQWQFVVFFLSNLLAVS